MQFHEIIEGDPIFVPLINFEIPAGFPSPAMDYMEERIDLTEQLAPRPLSTFYSKCEGDSMVDACIPSGSILVIDKSLTAKSGDIVVAYLNGGFTVKYIKFQDLNGGFTVKYIKFQEGKCFLIPANKKKNYPVTEITEEMGMMVWGVVTNIVIDTKNIRLCTL